MAANKGASPLLGYNTNVRHKGKLYHIQTEDSGLKHPHIITHLFADGGRIVASKKTSYAEHVGAEDWSAVVKKMMQDQHKGMFIALRDGVYDDDAGEPEVTVPVAIDTDAFEAAAAKLSAPMVAAPEPTASGVTAPGRPAVAQGLYQTTEPAAPRGRPAPRAPESIFGSDLLSEKSLDEVILSYLAEDLEEPKE